MLSLDALIINFDQILKCMMPYKQLMRPNPSKLYPEAVLNNKDKQLAIQRFRVNHSGEVCAQALYLGQAFTAKNVKIQQILQQAANEEIDHLNWCYERLKELGGRTSWFNFFWFSTSVTIGAFSGLWDDDINLGFLEETERQVNAHLQKHINHWPQHDLKSISILKQMQLDETQHANMAHNMGGKILPIWIIWSMKVSAKIMTQTAKWI